MEMQPSVSERLTQIYERLTADHVQIKQALLAILNGKDGLGRPDLIPAITVMHGIVHQTITAYKQLWEAAAGKNIMYLAYNARNLLELVIWAEFCCMSPENTLRLFRDANQDLAGMRNAIRALHEGIMDAIVAADLNGVITYDTSYFSEVGLDPEDDKYLTVATAAKILGPTWEMLFKARNKVLSKFVHPTAFIVSGSGFAKWEESAEVFVKNFFEMGVESANGVLNRVRQWISECPS